MAAIFLFFSGRLYINIVFYFLPGKAPESGGIISVDKQSTSNRSALMARVKKHTLPEIALRAMLHRLWLSILIAQKRFARFAGYCPHIASESDFRTRLFLAWAQL